MVMFRSLVLAAVSATFLSDVAAVSDFRHEYDMYLKRFGKQHTADVKPLYFAAFVQNYKYITAENAKNHSYKLGFNPFTDIPREYFIMTRFNHKQANATLSAFEYLGEHQLSASALPDSVDWRQQGAVTAVKDQGQCGSCYAFGATGALEGAWKIANDVLPTLSEQQFVDCSYDGSDHSILTPIFGGQNSGCFGGEPYYAFEYAKTHALCTETSYPYTAKDTSDEYDARKAAQAICSKRLMHCSEAIPEGAVLGYKVVQRFSETALMDAVAQQPVAVGIDADADALHHYSSGVLSSACGFINDHIVLLVGYGREETQDYWLLKNSWGSSWGDNGYFKLYRGKLGFGECGIKTSAHYPIVKKMSLGSVVV